MTWKAALIVVTAGALAQLTSIACGPPCADDRCSLQPIKPQVTRVDYTKKPDPSSTGSATPPPVGSGSAVVVAVGSGSAKPPPLTAGSGSAIAAGSGAGSGSVTPPPPVNPLANANYEVWDGDQFKMHVISKGTYPASHGVKFELVKTPTKTPFVVTLLVKASGASGAPEGVWNDCPEAKIKCDSGGTKTHVMKKAGQIMFQAGINWTVTGITDDKGTLVTWTNNLSREVLSIRLFK